MTEPEYRQDDTTDGYCPQCRQPLTALTVGARGYCDTHGWQWADWRTDNRDPGDETDDDDDSQEGLYTAGEILGE